MDTETLPGNQDIQAGPTVTDLPAPYQPPSDVLQPSQGGPVPANWWLPQPPVSAQRSWSAAPFARAAFSQLPPNVAGPAITQALRLEGLLGFDADRKAGVPVAEAMAKWAPKLYADHPSVITQLSKRPPVPFVPSEAQVGGQSMIQVSPNRFAFKPKAPPPAFAPTETQVGDQRLIQMSPNRFAFPPNKGANADLKAADVLRATTAELTQLSKAIDQASEARDQPAVRALRLRHSEVLNRLHDMTTGGGMKAPKKSRPSKGFVDGGHRFLDKAGVPANDPNNWEPVE